MEMSWELLPCPRSLAVKANLLRLIIFLFCLTYKWVFSRVCKSTGTNLNLFRKVPRITLFSALGILRSVMLTKGTENPSVTNCANCKLARQYAECWSCTCCWLPKSGGSGNLFWNEKSWDESDSWWSLQNWRLAVAPVRSNVLTKTENQMPSRFLFRFELHYKVNVLSEVRTKDAKGNEQTYFHGSTQWFSFCCIILYSILRLNAWYITSLNVVCYVAVTVF